MFLYLFVHAKLKQLSQDTCREVAEPESNQLFLSAAPMLINPTLFCFFYLFLSLLVFYPCDIATPQSGSSSPGSVLSSMPEPLHLLSVLGPLYSTLPFTSFWGQLLSDPQAHWQGPDACYLSSCHTELSLLICPTPCQACHFSIMFYFNNVLLCKWHVIRHYIMCYHVKFTTLTSLWIEIPSSSTSLQIDCQ